MRDDFRFALDAVLTNRRRARLTVAIIAVGVASLVGIETAVGVLADRVAGSFDKLGAGLFTIQPKDGAPPISYRQAVAFRDACPSAAVWSRLSSRAQVRGPGRATDPVVRIVACDEGYVPCQGAGLSAGRNFTSRETAECQPVALIGEQVRQKLFGAGSGLGERIAFDGRRFRVVGVLDRQGALFGEGLDRSVLIPADGSAEGYSVTVRPSSGEPLSPAVAAAGRTMASIRRLLPGAEPDFEIVRADSTQAIVASVKSKLSLAALVIGLITMLGASVGLMNSLLVSVKERTREIGTRRALGARAKAVERQFLLESVLIGQAGNIAGTALGLAFGALVAWGLDGRFPVPWLWLGAATLLSLAVSLASGLLPARRAAALDPVEALRAL